MTRWIAAVLLAALAVFDVLLAAGCGSAHHPHATGQRMLPDPFPVTRCLQLPDRTLCFDSAATR